MTDQGNARAHLQASQLTPEEGALSGVEYTIIFVLVAAIAVGTWQTFGPPAQRGGAGVAPRGATSTASAHPVASPPAASAADAQQRGSAAPSGS